MAIASRDLRLQLFEQNTVIREPDVELVASLNVIPNVLQLALEITSMPVAILARVTPERWLACAVVDNLGLGIREGLVIDPIVTLCREVRKTQAPLGFHHASQDPIFKTHAIPAIFGVESYLAVPVMMPAGQYWGNLCVVGVDPVEPFLPARVAQLQLLAGLVGRQIEDEERVRLTLDTERQALDATQLALMSERDMGRWLEQVLAVVGHDLRNPLASIVGGARLLQGMATTADMEKIVARIHRSAERMVTLVDDLLDVERARLCGEIGVRMRDVADVTPLLRHVVEEIALEHAERLINLSFKTPGALACRCDPARLGQLLSNLVKNALDHGAPGRPIDVRIALDAEELVLEVCNEGTAIDAARRGEIFKPFVKRSSRSREQGLGVGLFIVKKIAEGHCGDVQLMDDAGRTCFVFRMPANA